MLIEMKNICKMYGTLKANHNVNLSLKDGEVLAVVGENGAGKSTCMKILYGLERATSGEIYLDGKLTYMKSPTEAIRAGIGMVQQHFMLFSEFTVAENIVYGNEPHNKSLFFDRKGAEKIVKELSDKYLLDVDPTAKIKDCSVGMQQRVEILKVLYQNASTIILDEPSAVLTPQEVTELFKTVRQLVSLGKSVIIITHKLHEVMEISNRVVVLRAGEVIQEMNTEDTSIEELSYLMVGRKIVDQTVEPQATGDTILNIKALRYVDDRGHACLDGVDLHIKAGEIVGIAGVSGNGQSELIECIGGLLPVADGSIELNGINITNWQVHDIRKAEYACIPEDRYKYGCAKEGNLAETAIMGHQDKKTNSKYGVLLNNNIRLFTQSMLDRYDVRNSGQSQKAGELSGGNIQKLIVARELEQNSAFLIAAEPTRGVDIGAMEFIHDKILEKRKQGGAILLVSSELSEIRKLCDRIYTIYNGKLNHECTRENATEESLGLMMMGGNYHEEATE